VLFVVVIGGIGALEGLVLGAQAFYLMRSCLSDFGPYYLMGLGLLAIAVMLFFPLDSGAP
jgi:branched-chain amino acid transport system permease protein